MTTVRLSNYQKKVLDEAKKQIDKARNCKSIYEYLTEVNYFHDRIINSINNNPEYLHREANLYAGNSNRQTGQRVCPIWDRLRQG